MKKFKVGEVLAAVCAELNVKQADVAKIINMTPQNVSRIFQAENVSTDTIDRMISGLGVNIYSYLAKKWEDLAKEDPSFELKEPQGEYFRHVPKYEQPAVSKPKVSLLIEIDADRQEEIFKMLKV